MQPQPVSDVKLVGAMAGNPDRYVWEQVTRKISCIVMWCGKMSGKMTLMSGKMTFETCYQPQPRLQVVFEGALQKSTHVKQELEVSEELYL